LLRDPKGRIGTWSLAKIKRVLGVASAILILENLPFALNCEPVEHQGDTELDEGLDKNSGGYGGLWE
jgi:hypothetical protein